MSTEATLGLVLSGGGARGAYELGVLSWIAEHRPAVLERVRVVTGSSVGAVNAVFLASHGFTPEAVGELEALWLGLEVTQVLQFSLARFMRILAATGKRLTGRTQSPTTGVISTGPLQELVRDRIDWDQLSGHLASGRLHAVAVAATEIGSGQTHLFVDRCPDLPNPRWPHDRSTVALPGRLTAEHVLASTSLPLLFSPVQVGDFWYTDGGLRQNTPLSPALRLGAERLLLVTLRGPDPRLEVPGAYPGLGTLLGKLFNSIFLDRLLWDLDRLDRINDVLEAGEVVYGDDFVTRLQGALANLGRRPYRPVPYLNVHPTMDIGVVAARLLRDPQGLRSHLSGPMRALLSSDNMNAADAASYLLFDGVFARELITLGRADASGHADAFDRLLDP